MSKGRKFLSDLKLHSDYLKWRPQERRYETYEEACEDIINGHRKKYDNIPELEPYLESALESLKEMGIMASQRNLQYRYPQIKRSNLRMYNCTSTHAMRNSVFQEVFYLALNGCGVGVGLLIPFVKNISKVQKRVLGTKTFVIEDSIEGWANSLGVLMSSYFVDKQPFPEYAGYEVKFDYSQIREKGSFISGGFKAPGHEPLKSALEKIEQIIENWIVTQGNELRPIIVGDIICHASNAVLSGGVRRAALNFIVDPNDEEMIMSKTGDWYITNKQRERTNNSVLLLRSLTTKEEFERIVRLNEGISDIGFVLANSWFDMFNPCYEISKLPVLYKGDLSKIHYDDIEAFVKANEHLFGVQGCNLNEIVAEKCTTLEKFLRFCRDAAILGTLQAGYTKFPYLGETTEKIFEREALLGISIIGWMNNPKLFNAEWLRKGAEIVKATNKEVAAIIGINPAARTTCVKPGGNSSVVAMTVGGISAEEARQYFRVMQINKENEVAKFVVENMPFMIEESVHSDNKTDYVIYVPIETPKNAILKNDILGVKHLEYIKLVQENWVLPGTNEDLCAYKGINHNVSCTVNFEGDKTEMINFIWENKEDFTAISFLQNTGSRGWNQAPLTELVPMEDIVQKYGVGAMFAAGLIVDGLHYFGENLWKACDSVQNKNVPLVGTKEQTLLMKYWISRAKKFAKNYFKGDISRMISCLKDVHILHKWETISKQFKPVDLSKILTEPAYKDVSDYAATACAGGACSIVDRIK
jgi:ribonucleoside-diphosphate reductase alpha chain